MLFRENQRINFPCVRIESVQSVQHNAFQRKGERINSAFPIGVLKQDGIAIGILRKDFRAEALHTRTDFSWQSETEIGEAILHLVVAFETTGQNTSANLLKMGQERIVQSKIEGRTVPNLLQQSLPAARGKSGASFCGRQEVNRCLFQRIGGSLKLEPETRLMRQNADGIGYFRILQQTDRIRFATRQFPERESIQKIPEESHALRRRMRFAVRGEDSVFESRLNPVVWRDVERILIEGAPPEESAAVICPEIPEHSADGCAHAVQIGGDPHPDRSSVQIDYEQEGYDVGRQLLAEGRTEPVFIGNDLETNPQLAGLRRCFDENGVALNESLLVNSDAQLSNRLETILNIKKTPEAIYAANGSLMRISTVLKQHKLDWIDGCRLVADRYAQPIPGWMIWQDAREIARVAIELLDEKIKQPDSPVRTVMISRTLQPSGLTVRKLQRESFRDERNEQRFQ